MKEENILETLEEVLEEGVNTILDDAGKALTKRYKGLHLLVSRDGKWKYYGKVININCNQVADRNYIYYSISVDYINKEGKERSISISLSRFNKVSFFNTMEDARLFAALNNC